MSDYPPKPSLTELASGNQRGSQLENPGWGAGPPLTGKKPHPSLPCIQASFVGSSWLLLCCWALANCMFFCFVLSVFLYVTCFLLLFWFYFFIFLWQTFPLSVPSLWSCLGFLLECYC